MPTATMRFCGHCGQPHATTVRCATCTKATRQRVDRARGSRHERGYGNAWDRESARWKALHPFCGMRFDGQLHPEHSECAKQGIRYAGGPENPLHTDHIIPREQGGPDSDTNYQSLCERCHRTKTNKENNLGGSRLRYGQSV